MREPIPLPDVNVLIAAHVKSHRRHQVAHNWLTRTPEFATCSITESGFVRLLMNPAINANPHLDMVREALHRLRRQPGWRYWPDVASFDTPAFSLTGIRGYRQVTDFHLVNLAASYGGRVVTLDGRIRSALSKQDQRYVSTLSET